MGAHEAQAQSAAVLMDRIYRHQSRIYDLTRKHYLLGRDRLIADLDPPAGGTILEVGCGTGRNLVAAARRYPHARLFGLDVSSVMLERARHAIGRAGFERRIAVARSDAAGFAPEPLFGRARFERVFFAYSLSMIPEWAAALRMALDVVAPEGRLHVVDFGQQADLPATFRRLLFAWLRRFHVVPRPEHEAALRAEADRLGAVCATTALYRGYAWSATVTLPPAACT